MNEEPMSQVSPTRDFEGNLKAQLLGLEHRSHQQQVVLDFLNRPDSPRKRRVLARWEKKCRAQAGVGETGAIDWTKINWGVVFKIISVLVSIIMMFATEDHPPEEV